MTVEIDRSVDTAPSGGQPQSLARRGRSRTAWLLAAIVLLLVVCFASLAIGSRSIALTTVVDALLHPDGSDAHIVVSDLRVPRTILGLLCGAAFAVAGALIQAFTRNPLADPGILGVNAGAGFAVVLGVAIFGVTRIQQYLGFALAGAALATVVVYLIAGRGAGGVTPLRITLVGVALSAVLGGISQALTLVDSETFNRMRFWGAGSITDRPEGTIQGVVVLIGIGLVLALLCGIPLNAMGLGDDTARALGVNIGLMRAVCVLAVALLCGAGTAAVGPIGFIGLMCPHVIRWLVGPDQRWILPFCLVLGPVLLLVSDIIGRLIVWPAELQVGVVTAFVGAPILMMLVRRTRVSSL